MALPPPPPDRIFAVMADGSDALTWGDMVTQRNRIAHSLVKHLPADMKAGAIYSKNTVWWALCHQVCTALGLRFSPINWHLVADEIAYIVDDCDADVLFFSAEYANTVSAIRSRVPKVSTWVCMDGAVDGSIPLQRLLADAPLGASAPEHNRVGGQVGYTGGTTGKPKGAVRMRAAAPSDPTARMKTLEEWGFLRRMPHPIQLVSAPQYHALPMAWYIIGLALGQTSVFQKRFDGLEALAAISKFKVNGFYMPPILLKRLIQIPIEERSKYDLSSVKAAMVGGAACPSAVKQEIFKMFGPVLSELYGASELGGVTIMPPEMMLKKPLSCGRPVYGIDVILLDDDKRKITKPRVPGEIFAKGGNFDGYHKLDDKTKDGMFGDYFSVGDVGYFDEDGYLYISDRKIDMVVSGGVNIYPAQVEEILHGHPDLEDVAVFGVPDEEYGERVHAALKPRSGRSVSAKAVLDWCDGKIGKFQLPKEADVSFHSEDFPRSEAGKLRKKVLREAVLSKVRVRSKL
eukprot:TRINITY_DN23241_c0_g4_i1.p1 TRINITY_DN23241_c0_g4~~TRINITY_DN23241_c0_g4_i1.p1  ORF type:complete len:516 (-),score=85.73 TRINITY_DN23241_c0_g4_i1:47-1594(-)